MYRQLGEDTLDFPKWGAMGGWLIQTGMVPGREGPHPYLQPYTVPLHLQGLPCTQLHASSAVPPAFATMHNWSSPVLPSPNYP